MKVVLTGCTGFVGGEVLQQCLQNTSITSVIALSRRPLSEPVANHPKLTVKIIDDFLSYPESLMQDLHGAEACIWALGKAMMVDVQAYRKLSIDYTMAAVKAFDEHLAPNVGTGKPFRFVYLSGAATEKDQNKSLWFGAETRRIRGEVENGLIAHSEDHLSRMEIYILRPAMVLSKQTNLRSLVFGLGPSIKVDILAGYLIDVAIKGDANQIMENSMMT